ncbi:class I SAM-dependent methyltransferase [Streptomyces sp. IB2014 016-6]|uniref:class I SAM-dependent methyltransferase n=1 Tax=Streptomyces sp. IB2014 016-6 TaxID=2517818 RepID=UPI0011C770C6|nr:class I SAM-dependent methyltransferase [Streptomyces sp. IB2014 016-6]TXL90818.1 class I SAM-dependent methyltransferase [Streptomyces sp. IB2014 016-6]
MVDPLFADPALASWYDALSPTDERGDFGFYLPRVMSARSVLDVGCGTGSLLGLAREAGHRGRLLGLDPGAGMLEQARRRPEPDIEWIAGDLESTSWEREFDFVVMTGHAFQALLGDDELRAALAAVHAALTDDGRFGFETRNPLARAWESWTTVAPVDVPAPGGEGSAPLRMTRQVRSVEGDIVSFRTSLTLPGEHAPRHSDSTLRFLGADRLDAFLAEAGLVVEERYGDWERGPLTDVSPEIITVARRTPA